jgi:hypothetical protein
MTKITLGLPAAALLGLAAFSAPASALPASQLSVSSQSNIVDVAMRRHQDCHMRTVVIRKHGHKVVRQVRVCH